LSVAPAVASDTFHALGTLPPAEQANLTPLSDGELAAVEGAALFDFNFAIAVQVAVLPQINVCVVCENVVQVTNGVIVQHTVQ
jgi:hypothetical protein